ncbi:MAG: 3,4-dihydroxy-2-butanone-4-phosphate synthase, partial [Bacteriovorax sp.]
SSEVAKKCDLPLMVLDNAGTTKTAFTVSIDASSGIHSGISSRDRSTTIKKLSDREADPSDFERPGHVFPLIAHDEGVMKREGHTEAAIDLLKLAGLYPVGVLCETLNASGEALKGEELLEFARTFKIKIISIEEIKNYRLGLLGKTI